MSSTKEITTRTLLRNFSEIKQNLFSGKVDKYTIKSDNHKVIEINLSYSKKSNIENIIKAAKKLPKNLKVSRSEINEKDLLPKRVWNK